MSSAGGWKAQLKMNLTFFRSPADFRQWLEEHHSAVPELWVGFYRKDSGKPSITWPESVDEALCFGWIDGLRKRVDEESYKIRFSPRRRRSIWSAININRARQLAAQGRIQPAGLQAFQARETNKSGIYSYEQRRPELDGPYEKKLRKNKSAWEFFQAQPPSYRKVVIWWVVSAKREETRLKRLDKLIKASAQGRRL
jgi:uncharacterized protein YdeI (YjbR/CyaY-like superfamily)